MSYVRKKTWLECGPVNLRRVAGGRRGLGAAAVDSSGNFVYISSDPGPDYVPPVALPEVFGVPYIPPPPDTIPCLAGSGALQPGQVYCTPYQTVMPCLSGSGPLQPGQAYCDPLAPAGSPAAPAAASTLSTMWTSIQPYALPIGLGIGALLLVGMRGGRR